jgi:hypothetical protein
LLSTACYELRFAEIFIGVLEQNGLFSPSFKGFHSDFWRIFDHNSSILPKCITGSKIFYSIHCLQGESVPSLVKCAGLTISPN